MDKSESQAAVKTCHALIQGSNYLEPLKAVARIALAALGEPYEEYGLRGRCDVTHVSATGTLRCTHPKGHTGDCSPRVSRCEETIGDHSRCRREKGHTGDHVYKVFRHG